LARRCAEGDVDNGRWHGCAAEKGKNEEEYERRMGVCFLSYRGNKAQYRNTAPAGGSSYAPDVEKGKGEREAE